MILHGQWTRLGYGLCKKVSIVPSTIKYPIKLMNFLRSLGMQHHPEAAVDPVATDEMYASGNQGEVMIQKTSIGSFYSHLRG